MRLWLDAHTGGDTAAFPAPDLSRRLVGDESAPSLEAMLEGGIHNGDDVYGGYGALRVRAMFGGSVAWATGVDASAGGFDGFAYRVAVSPLGLGLVTRSGHMVSVIAGGGLSDPGGGGGFGWEVPISVLAATQLGPVRVLGWARAAWIFDDDARQDGSNTLFAVDELHAGVGVRWGRHHHYWPGASAGVGPYLGLTLTEAAGVRSVGVALGLDLWGD